MLCPIRWCQKVCTVHPSCITLPALVEAEIDGQPCLTSGSVETAVLWPWDLLHWLFTSGKLLQWISDDPTSAGEKVSQYWQHAKNQEWFSDHNLQEASFSTCVPIFWHADGVKIYKAQKAWVYSFCSATTKGESTKTRLLFTLVRETHIKKYDTHDAMARHIAYVMRVLGRGVFPLEGPDGKPFPPGSREYLRAGTNFANGWQFLFAGFRGDWEARVICHKFERNYAAKHICERCPASRTGLYTFGNLLPDAPYKSVQWTHEEYLSSCSRHRVSQWAHVPGWRRERNLEVTHF